MVNLRSYAFAVMLCTLLASPGSATLYSGGGGYQYTFGDKDYWSHDAWGSGGLRLEGGWYPFAQAALSRDSFYEWIAAPGIGLEKGFAGLGKARVGYTYYRGDVRDGGLTGTAHGGELGASRAFSASLLGDLSYRMTAGDLLSGVSRELEPRTGGTNVSLLYAVVHQGIASLAWQMKTPLGPIQWDGSVSAARGSDDLEVYSESVGLSAPILNPDLRIRAALTLTQIQPDTTRTYGSFGLSYSFAGRLNDTSEQNRTDRARKR